MVSWLSHYHKPVTAATLWATARLITHHSSLLVRFFAKPSARLGRRRATLDV